MPLKIKKRRFFKKFPVLALLLPLFGGLEQRQHHQTGSVERLRRAEAEDQPSTGHATKQNQNDVQKKPDRQTTEPEGS